MSKGVRGYIKSRIPQPWEYILKKNRKYCEFVECIYKACRYSTIVGRRTNKRTIEAANRIMKRSYIGLIQEHSFEKQYKMWRAFYNAITEYENNCK